MKKETHQLERRGLPGGPNETFTYTTGVFSTEGFRMDSPDVNNYQNIIPSGSISMKERDGSPLRKGPIHGVDNLGNEQVMYPGFDYQFPGNEVTETLMAKMGGALLDKTIKCGNCGWEWKAADGGSDLYDCHKCKGGKGLIKAQRGLQVKPLYVESENDPRYKAYSDSLALYKGTKDISKLLHDNPASVRWEDSNEKVPSEYVKKIINTKKYSQLTKKEKEKVDEWNKATINPNIKPYKYETYAVNSPVGRIDKWFGPDEITKERKTEPYGQPNPFYKEPQQPVIVKQKSKPQGQRYKTIHTGEGEGYFVPINEKPVVQPDLPRVEAVNLPPMQQLQSIVAPTISEVVRSPKSYNVNRKTYNTKGELIDYYTKDEEGVDYERAMLIKSGADAWNRDILKRYGPQNEYRTPKSAADAAERLKQLRSEFEMTPNYQKGGEKKWLGNTLTKEGWVTSTTKGGNYISFTGNQRSDEWINKQIDTGKFGFDPKTGATFPLKKPVKGLSKEDQFMATKQYHDLRAPEGFTNESQQAQIDKLPEWQQDMLNAENTKRRKRVVYNNMQEVVKNPLFYAPGAIALAPIAATGLTAVGTAAAPYVSSALATQLPGMAAVPGATVGNAITAGFAGHGLTHIGPDTAEMYKNPSWENAFNVAMDVAESLPVFGPATKTIGEGYSSLKNINTSIVPELRQGLKTAGPSFGSSVNKTGIVSNNLNDLTYAKNWANKYGYKLPENLERIAQSDELTNRTIRGLADRHNTFVRGVSTNWEVLGQKNPEIIKYLEGQGFNLATEEGSKAAAEYMSTHIPMNTGYGRFGLKEGENALYLSNSVPTAEGYTYGNGYIVKVKRPTDFSSANRQDWLTTNDFDPSFGFKGSPFGEGIVKNDYIKRFPTNFRETLAITGDPNKMVELQAAVKEKEALYNQLAQDSWRKHNNLISDLKYRTDANYRNNTISDDPFVRDAPNFFDKMQLKYLQNKKDLTQTYYDFLPLKDIAKGVYGDADVWKAFGKNLFGKLDPFSHYAIKGQEGEKILETLRSTKVNPETWENISRAHINKYTDKLTRREEGGENITEANATTTSTPSPLVEYVVKKGDTLGKIAAANNTSIASIMRNNESISDPNIISVNQKINLVNKNVYTPKEEVYKDWNTIRDKKDKINKLSDEQKIVSYYNDKPEDTYLIVDKKNAVMKLYTGGNLTKSFEVGVGQNPGDAQTVTKVKDGKTDWSGGNKSTGAGIYTISNINPASEEYYNEPAFNLKNENGIEVATTIHGTPKPRRIRFNNGTVVDNRMSNGCINGKCEDLKELYGQLDINTKVYILPEDAGNNFQIIDGKPALKVSAQNRQKYNSYVDQKGVTQKGQGANQTTNTLVYKPIKAFINEKKFKEDVFQWNDFNDEKEYTSTTKPFIVSLTTNKKDVMKAAKISSDVYNELAKMAFGIYGAESNFGDTHTAVGNLARGANKFLDPKSASSPDYKSKATTYGADENYRSVGLTQLKFQHTPWVDGKVLKYDKNGKATYNGKTYKGTANNPVVVNELSPTEKAALKAVGITSNQDFLDPEKAAIGTVTLLGIRYNEQLNNKQKQDVWKYLPSKWNTRENYSSRVKKNSSYLSFKQLDKKQDGGEYILEAQKGKETEDTSWTAYFNPANWGTSRYDDKTTFKEAFRAARNEGDSDFLWKGTRYTTELKAAPTTTAKPSAPKGITPELLVRQAYRESTFNPKAVSPAGYKGLGQIGDQVIKDYKKANNITGTIDPFNMKQNSDVHKYSMNELYNSSFINKPGQSEQVRLAKTLAAYNWGRTNVSNLLNDLKEDGVDIYNSLDWVNKLPKESRDYINDILLQKNTTFNTDFSKAVGNQKNKSIKSLYGYRTGGESKPGPLMTAYNRLPAEKKMGGAIEKKQIGGENIYVTQTGSKYTGTKKVDTPNGPRYYQTTSPNYNFMKELFNVKQVSDSIPKVNLTPRAIEVLNKKEFGGQLNSGNITMYRDYVKGIIGNETEAVKNYDKLNRIYYSKAKELGMTASNYVMTYIVGNS